jgi:acetoin utilization protein AcuB
MYEMREVGRVQPRVREGMVSSPVITPRTTVSTALHLLRENCVPALPVFDEGQFVGLVDEKSLLRLSPSEATTLDQWEVHDLLDRLTVARVVKPSATIGPDESLRQAAILMNDSNSQALAVLEGDRLAGMLPWNALLAVAMDIPSAQAACA